MTDQTYEHFQIDIDQDNILWLTLDRKNSSVNTLNTAVLEEFALIVKAIKKNKKLKGVILKSGKMTGFILGADIQEFTQLKNRRETLESVKKVQAIFNSWEKLLVPTLAMIDGFCLGGGMELALACHYRIASKDSNTKLGLPEVKLGIRPGWGGGVRIVHMLGVFKAMSLILTGRLIDAKYAAKIGLIDDAVPLRVLEKAAKFYIRKKTSKQEASLWLTLIDTPPIRLWIGRLLYHRLAKKVKKTHYPAPYSIVKTWIRDGALGSKAMLNEAKSIARLFFTPTSQELVRLFLLQSRLKAFGKAKADAISHIHVIGAGTMGAEIAARCLLSNLTVSLQDNDEKQIAKGIRHIYKLVNKATKKDFYKKTKIMDALFPDTKGVEVSKADVIIEAVFENLEVKQNLFKAIEAKIKPTAVMATNTSTIPLSDIRIVLKNPRRLLGIHFFNPVSKMQLVEVVSEKDTHQASIDSAMNFVVNIKRLPLPVKSAPGFLVNRILMPYLLESMLMLEEGYSPYAVDKVAVDFGMLMGPLAVADTVGLDICLNAAQILAQHLGGKIPKILHKKVTKGQLGKKTGKGFYSHTKKGIVKRSIWKRSKSLPSNATDRLILPILIEAITCLKEGIVADTDLLDAGIVFGTGFAPFHGGIIQYAKLQGIKKIMARISILEKQYGKRFALNADQKKILKKLEEKKK